MFTLHTEKQRDAYSLRVTSVFLVDPQHGQHFYRRSEGRNAICSQSSNKEGLSLRSKLVGNNDFAEFVGKAEFTVKH